MALGAVTATSGCLEGGVARALGIAGPDPRIVDHTYEERTYEIRDWVGDQHEERVTIIVEVVNDGEAGGMQIIVETLDGNGERVGRFGQPIYMEEDEYAQVAVGGVLMGNAEDYEVSVVVDESIGPAYAHDGGSCRLGEEGEPVGEDGQCPMGHYG